MPLSNQDLIYEMTRSAAYLNSVNWHFIDLLGEFDERGAWREGGYSSLMNWLDHRCGMAPGAARERIRVARKLRQLKLIDQAFQKGEISYSKVRAITRAASKETERVLLKMACRCSAGELESLVRTYEKVGANRGDSNHQTEKRSLEWYYDSDGMLVLNARLPADLGAVVVKALGKAVDIRKEEWNDYFEHLYYSSLRDDSCQPESAIDATVCSDQIGSVEEPHVDAEGDRSDHVVVSSEEILPVVLEADHADEQRFIDDPERQSVLHPSTDDSDHAECHPDSPEMLLPSLPSDAGSDPQSDQAPAKDVKDVSAETSRLLLTGMSEPGQLLADGLCDLAEHWLASADQGGKRRPNHQRYEVVLHIDRDKLASAAHSPRYYLEGDTAVTPETGRRIACDADVSELIEDDQGMLLKLGRKQRIVSPLLLKALKRRDKCCRFPSCSYRKYLDSHHIRHWIDGGETNANNLIMLCSRHHALLHDGHYSIRVQENGKMVFYDRHNEVIEPVIFPQFHKSSRKLTELDVKFPSAENSMSL